MTSTKSIELHPNRGGVRRTVRLVLQPMTLADVDDVVELEKLCFPEDPWPAETYRHELANELGSVYLVVRVGHDDSRSAPPVVANGGCHLTGGEAYITTIATHPEWRRCKIGEWLLLHLARAARKAGAKTVKLEVRESNAAALGLYRKHGFAVTGRVEGYYADEAVLELALFKLDDSAVWRRLGGALHDPE
ncbi:MAG: GNAT family N-acetyltransferase [Gemmatimonadota bacterium]|nr:MAG: GNAT family N-acetyltransferase [Gemmatimonadota bacterium]